MGVSGSGKSTLAAALALALDWHIVEADAFHPPGNIAKMASGVPLTDADRAPWLVALRAEIDRLLHEGRSGVLACSALREQYRQVLRAGIEPAVPVVYLRASEELLRQRLIARRGHYMKADLLDSQLATLEEPAGAAVTVDAAAPVEDSVAAVLTALGLARRPGA